MRTNIEQTTGLDTDLDSTLEKLAGIIGARMLAGASDEELLEELTAGGFEQELATAMLSGCRQGMDNAISKVVSEGVDNAFERFRAEKSASPHRRLALRIPALLLGCLFTLCSLGGFLEGDFGAACVLLLIGVGLVSMFFMLRPATCPQQL